MGCSLGKKKNYQSLTVDPAKAAAEQATPDAESGSARAVELQGTQEGAAPAPASKGGLLDSLTSGFSALTSSSASPAAGASSPPPPPEKDLLFEMEQKPGKDLKDVKDEGAAKLNEAKSGLAQAQAFMGRSSDTDRAVKYIAAFKELPPDSPVLKGVACFVQWGVKPLIVLGMGWIWLMKMAYWVYTILPTNIIQMICGGLLCFFGGVYWAFIPAVEAALNMGGASMWDNLKLCYEDLQLVAEASARDDEEQAKELDNMSFQDVAQHKAKVALMAVKDPQRLQQAGLSLMNVYVAVIATLKFQFARTVAIALGIGNMLTLPATRILGPPLAFIMGEDLKHWVPAIIDLSIKIIVVWMVSWIQAGISAFYSGLRGGRLFAAGFFHLLSAKGIMDKLPDWVTAKPFDPDQSYLDEAIAYPLAAVGFYMQVRSGFSVPFPLNFVLLPFSTVEGFLEFQILT